MVDSYPLFTLRNSSHPTTAKEADWYEYLKRSHCHKCPEQIRIDCDVEDFLSCYAKTFIKLNKCNCFLCIKDKKLREILQDFFDQVEERKREKEKEEKPKKARIIVKQEPTQEKLFKKPRSPRHIKAA
jgi:hypothetical protein